LYRLIAVEPLIGNPTDRMIGYLETPDQYTPFEATQAGVKVFEGVSKKRYKSYEHYAGVMGKFVPEVFFFIHPQPVTELTLAGLKQAFTQHQKGVQS